MYYCPYCQGLSIECPLQPEWGMISCAFHLNQLWLEGNTVFCEVLSSRSPRTITTHGILFTLSSTTINTAFPCSGSEQWMTVVSIVAVICPQESQVCPSQPAIPPHCEFSVGCSSKHACFANFTFMYHLCNKSLISYPLFDLGVPVYPLLPSAELAPRSRHSEYMGLMLMPIWDTCQWLIHPYTSPYHNDR